MFPQKVFERKPKSHTSPKRERENTCPTRVVATNKKSVLCLVSVAVLMHLKIIVANGPKANRRLGPTQ